MTNWYKSSYVDCDKMLVTMDREPPLFSDWLNEVMRKQKYTQASLARASGLSRQAINYYLSHKSKKPDDNALQKLAHALHLSPITVFQAAGKLPPVSETSKAIAEINEAVNGLPLHEITLIVEFAKHRRRITEEKGSWDAAKKTESDTVPIRD